MHDQDENLINVHTTAQDLDPWYVSPDSDDEYPREETWVDREVWQGVYDVAKDRERF